VRKGEKVKSKYLDLQTGEVINAKQLLDWEKGKDKIWEAAEDLYSLLANMAEERENESHRLLHEASVIRDYLNTYDRAADMLEGKELAGELYKPNGARKSAQVDSGPK
jgi:hypothetical protein